MTNADFRFRRAFLRAIRQLRIARRITPEQHRRFYNAAHTMVEIELDGARGFLIEHLRVECRRIAAEEEIDYPEDIGRGFWFDFLTKWLVDNWATIARVLLSLLVLLDTPEPG